MHTFAVKVILLARSGFVGPMQVVHASIAVVPAALTIGQIHSAVEQFPPGKSGPH